MNAFDELCFYTLAHGDPSFIHQHVVDAFGAQYAVDADKPIRLTFALVGLCLHVERQYTGREVQKAHMRMALRRQEWPRFSLPPDRGGISVDDVLDVPAGVGRDRMIHQWCQVVWAAYAEHRPAVLQLLEAHGFH